MKLPENIKAIIFDIDGTLLDSLDAWADADRIFLRENNIPYDPMISEKLKTMHFVSAAQYFIDELGVNKPLEEITRRIYEIISRKYCFEIPAKPHTAEFISLCEERGIKMCAATSNLKDLAEGALINNGFYEKFAFVLTSDEVGSGKDDPEIFFKCAEKMGVSPENTAVFEDSLHAAASASNAGFFTVGVYDSHYAAEFDRLKEICSITVKDFGELI